MRLLPAFAISTLLAMPAGAQAPAPTLTVHGQAATFTAPVALLDEPSAHLSLLFPAATLTPAADIAARARGSWDDAARAAAPAVVVDLDFTPGSTSGMVGQLKACRMRAVGFKASWQVSGGAAACHIVSVGGLLKPTGGAGGLFEGSGDGYALRLPFFVTIPAGLPTTTTDPATPATAAPVTAPVPVPLNTVTGTGTYQGQTVKVTHGLAWWAATQGQVRVALFDHAPKAGLLTKAREGDFSDDPSIIDVYAGFKDAGRDLAAVDYCYVNVTFPKGGPIGANTNAKGCGLDAITTTGTPGGTVFMHVKGSGPGPSGRFTWDVTFNLPIAK